MKVELMTHSGDDILVVNAARASFGKESEWAYVGGKNSEGEWEDDLKVLRERDRKLINFLAREHHLLPFRHPQVTLRCKAPIFLARQLGKHQVGFSWSEESRRYIITEPEFYWPDKWRKAAENVKQGSSEEEVKCLKDYQGNEMPEYSPQDYAEHLAGAALTTYKGLLESGVAPELARMILPQNLMVTWVWTGSLLGFYQMYAQRSFPTAQKEARDFAALVEEVIEPLYPVSWAALKEHQPWEEGRDG